MVMNHQCSTPSQSHGAPTARPFRAVAQTLRTYKTIPHSTPLPSSLHPPSLDCPEIHPLGMHPTRNSYQPPRGEGCSRPSSIEYPTVTRSNETLELRRAPHGRHEMEPASAAQRSRHTSSLPTLPRSDFEGTAGSSRSRRFTAEPSSFSSSSRYVAGTSRAQEPANISIFHSPSATFVFESMKPGSHVSPPIIYMEPRVYVDRPHPSSACSNSDSPDRELSPESPRFAHSPGDYRHSPDPSLVNPFERFSITRASSPQQSRRRDLRPSPSKMPPPPPLPARTHYTKPSAHHEQGSYSQSPPNSGRSESPTAGGSATRPGSSSAAAISGFEIEDHARQLVDSPKEWECMVMGENGKTCGYVSKKQLVTRHVKGVHLKYRPFACPYPGCGKAFPQKTSLDTHVNGHTGEMPHRCYFEGCNLRFKDPARRHRHMAADHDHVSRPHHRNQRGSYMSEPKTTGYESIQPWVASSAG